MLPTKPQHEGEWCPNPNYRLPCMCHCCYNYTMVVLRKTPSLCKPSQDCKYCADLSVWYLGSIAKPENKKGKADPDTAYAFTLTMPPDYKHKKPLDQVARQIVENGLTNKPYEKAAKWAFVLEYTEAGTPHIHGMYQTPSGRRIAAKYFKRYWDLWDEDVKLGHGHKGGYHQKARHEQSYIAYMQKDGVILKSEAQVKFEEDLGELISHQ